MAYQENKEHLAPLVANIKACFKSQRCIGGKIQLLNFMERKLPNGEIQSRITLKDGTPVESFDEFLDNIKEDDIEIREMKIVAYRGGLSYPGVKVVIKNMYVNLLNSRKEDAYLRMEYGVASGSQLNIGIAMGYVGDNDQVLDNKILYLDMYSSTVEK